jgi:hypothetical protein
VIYLGHGTSLSAKIGLGTLGKLGMQHGSISGKSNTSQNEEGKGELLSTSGASATTNGSASTSDHNITGQVVSSGLDGGDEVAHQFLVTSLVVVIVVGLHAVGKSMSRLALSGVVVEVLAYLGDLGTLVLVVVVVVIVVVLVLILLEARGDALSLGKGLLEEVVAEVQGGAIVVLQVGGHIGTLIVDGAVLIGEDSNLDTGAGRGADSAGVVGLVAIRILVVELLALGVLRGIDISIGLHVINVLALSVARGGVDVGTRVGIVVILIGVVVAIGRIGRRLNALVAKLAVLLLLLLLSLEGVGQIGVHVDNVLAVVVVASAAAVVGAHVEDDKVLGGKDGVGVLTVLVVVLIVVVVAIVVVGVLLDELTLLELDRVAGKIHLLGLIVVVLKLTKGGGAQHELGVHLCLGGVAADLGCEGVAGCGGADGGRGREEGEGELHGWIVMILLNIDDI